VLRFSSGVAQYRPAHGDQLDVSGGTVAGHQPYLPTVATIIVPAHNEAPVISRLLKELVSASCPGDLDVIVVANGCTDDTAAVAASFGPPVRVLSIPVPSKREALRVGDNAARDFPRMYVDADVELRAEDVQALASALQAPAALAASPRREMAMSGSPWLVRWYYEVWTRLPEVRLGLFGRGVIGVNSAGHQRLNGLPPLMSDDLAMSLVFTPDERIIVPDARVLVHAPRTLGDLVRRRARVAVGVTELERVESAPASTARTRPGDLLAIVGREPRMATRVAVFAVVTVLARLRAGRAVRRGDYSTWLRDESSRR
jgi:hypothetical protein